MATYKLIQDIEAEDKILGPLTLRQFIFALITAFFIYLCFISVAKGGAFLLVLFLPPALFFGFFAFPFGRDQPTELWALAKLNFWFKPRKRLWNQSGVKELVTITVPKKVEHIFTDGLSQNEVKSRLSVLANTLDSRGWAVKNVNAYDSTQLPTDTSSDRLIAITSLPQPQEVPNYRVEATDDMLDTNSSYVAQQFDTMINKSNQEHRTLLLNQLNGTPAAAGAGQPVAAPGSQWFMNGTPATQPQAAAVPVPSALDEAALDSQLKATAQPQQTSYSNLRTLQPLGTPAPVSAPTVAPPVTAPSDPAILSLSKNNDLNVATLAREARAAKHEDDQLQDEVVISLH